MINRRVFLKQSATTALAIGCLPSWAKDSLIDSEDPFFWSVNRLMGINPVSLKGEDPLVLTRKTFKAFNKMRVAAWEDGIVISPVSSFRSYSRQKAIFESKFKKFQTEGLSPIESVKKIIEYSTIPGTSRHHWGTDIDVIQGKIKIEGDVLLEEHFNSGGAFENLHHWLTDNAANYGFYLVYTNHPERKGFKYEPWHLSYAPESIPILKRYINKGVYEIALQQKVKGVEVINSSLKTSYLREQLLDINPLLLP